MATYKQKRAFAKIVDNHGNISKAMREVGYSPKTVKNPKNLTESKGFKELLVKHGLTDELILTALTDDIHNKPRNRKAELELAAKLKGWLRDGGVVAGNVNLVVISEMERPKDEDTNTPIQTNPNTKPHPRP